MQTEKLNRTVDSLRSLDLPAQHYTHKLDSLNQARQKATADFNGKLESLKSKTTGKLNEITLPPQLQEPVQALAQKVKGFDLNTDFASIPALDVPGYSLPDLQGLGNLSSSLGEAGKIGSLPKIETPVGDLGKLTEQAQGLQSDVKNITQGNLDEVKQLPKTLEEQAGKVEGIQELQKQSGVAQGYRDKVEQLNNPDAAKEKAIEMAKQAAVDHFAGKEEQLKAAMDQVSKYKQKYSSVSSLKDLPKRPPNPMKGKPFIERLVPGVMFQYQQKNFYLIDVNPYAGYRLTGRFTAGIGWNQRFAYDKKGHDWSARSRIFGPRAYVDFNLPKGFIVHLETEVMNSFVPSTIRINPEAGRREWVWGMMTGLKKEYRIYKNLKGTVLIQYNIFNPRYKAPYVDRLNSRIGFELPFKKKNKKSESKEQPR